MDFIIGLFWIGVFIAAALLVFNIGITIFFWIVSLPFILIGAIWEKFQDYRANRLQDAVNREVARQNRLDGYDQNGNKNGKA